MEFNREFFDAGIYRVGTQQRPNGTAFARTAESDDIVPLWVADMDFPSPPGGAAARCWPVPRTAPMAIP